MRAGADGAAVWTLNTTGSGVYTSADTTTSYGLNSDIFITGDWTGSGKTEIGVVRPTSSGVLEWVLNTTGTGTFNSADTVFFYGQNGDTPVVGDWNGDGKTDIGIVRPTSSGVREWVLNTTETGAYNSSDAVFFYGSNAAIPVVGRWAAPAALYSGAGVLNTAVQPLTTDALFVSTINQAIAAWQQAGLDPQDVARLQNVHYSVASLNNGLLGETSGNNITIDATAQDTVGPRARRRKRGRWTCSRRWPTRWAMNLVWRIRVRSRAISCSTRCCQGFARRRPLKMWTRCSRRWERRDRRRAIGKRNL